MQNVLQDAKPGRELDYLLVRANSWSGKPVYIELWVYYLMVILYLYKLVKRDIKRYNVVLATERTFHYSATTNAYANARDHYANRRVGL